MKTSLFSTSASLFLLITLYTSDQRLEEVNDELQKT